MVPAPAEVPADVLRAVEAAWSLELSGVAAPLHRGQESVAFRLGAVVLRIGPAWRSEEEAEWCYAVASEVSRHYPLALAPLRTARGSATIRVGGHPVSLWPFVDATAAETGNGTQARHAAQVLAGLHSALSRVTMPPRPPVSATTTAVPGLDDAQLDVWLAEFHRHRPYAHPLHGDYYVGNVLVREDRIVAVLDWDEAFVGPPEMELAWAACEWGDVLQHGNLDEARVFVHAYLPHGGTADELDDEAMAQLYRSRLRWELAYEEANSGRHEELPGPERLYRDRQRELFRSLRP